MAVTTGTVPAALADTLVTDSAVDDANPVQANSGSTTWFYLMGDGSSGVVTTSTSYIKVYDGTSGAPDSNNPDYVFPVPAGEKIEYVCSEGNALAGGLRYFGTSTKANGSTQAPTAAANALVAKFLFI
tara:strand:- start:33 stop:416 length:384 start_codon:yes stop_codon:yes gene_type:complete